MKRRHFDAEHEMFRKSFREFVKREIAPHYDAWERAISEFAAARLAQPADSLYPLAIGRTALAACRAAYDRWAARADDDLTVYLDATLTALAAGFAPDALRRPALAGS